MLNPLSWFIRWVLPRSRFALALSSHCYIAIDDDNWFESVAPKGVTVTTKAEALKSDTIVAVLIFDVSNYAGGLEFLKAQIGKRYDYKGAVGLGIAADRVWNEDDAWFCYELAAGCLKASGGEPFKTLSIITETVLIACAEEVVFH